MELIPKVGRLIDWPMSNKKMATLNRKRGNFINQTTFTAVTKSKQNYYIIYTWGFLKVKDYD